MDGFFANNIMGEEPDDSVLGDNAMGVARGASFLMGEDPKKDPVKPMARASLGDAPMGEKPTGNPLDSVRLGFSSGAKAKSDTSFGGETTIAKTSALGPNPLGPNPLGLDPSELDLLGLDSSKLDLPGFSAPEEIPLGNIVSLDDPACGNRIISFVESFASEVISKDINYREDGNSLRGIGEVGFMEGAPEDDGEAMEVALEIEDRASEATFESDGIFFDYGVSLSDDDFMPLGESVNDDEIGLGLEEDDFALTPLEEAPLAAKPKGAASEEMDPLKALLLAGGNPFGENAKSIAPDYSFGKEALKPKHFEPMKASGPRVNAENIQANRPLGDTPFGKEITPDLSFGKEALKPKKYEPKTK